MDQAQLLDRYHLVVAVERDPLDGRGERVLDQPGQPGLGPVGQPRRFVTHLETPALARRHPKRIGTRGGAADRGHPPRRTGTGPGGRRLAPAAQS
jgi:hypothetical protein